MVKVVQFEGSTNDSSNQCQASKHYTNCNTSHSPQLTFNRENSNVLWTISKNILLEIKQSGHELEVRSA